ncbi:MAG: FtsQ-type POTRA domain-containing protein [Gammaproteobacteria bacterium]|nr:FtsQ-type POTRA domain-containing protein [Gammaproteobacteria bacterium]NND39079.1 FtsQ-type POTRA domain-containing protein [Pseudomonadales bacterium]NNL10228.1 FtsQ-type POTRA domain-containing protein [Pseudomonadales bacterium]NNM11669.1 FtsQ-type POTRA domain-containing protein [Pseudomonadales bacterium]RZV57950.1 MAG: FtsQ-type POTRA domain-containing protein [Pseudomonadales bacterium]
MIFARQKSGAVRRSASGNNGAQLLGNTVPLLGRVLLLVLLLVMLVIANRGWQQLRQAPVDVVKIFGHSGQASSAQGVSETEIYRALDPHLENGFWQIDLAAVQFALESLPWVRRAVVQREWPGTLRVQIDEHLPVARWNASHVLASSGELIEARSLIEFASLPQIATPGGSAHSRDEIVALVEKYNQLQKMLAPQGLAIRELGSSMGANVWLIVEGETRIELGERDHQARLARLINLVESGVIASWQNIENADMRYTSGLAVKWRGEAGSQMPDAGGEPAALRSDRRAGVRHQMTQPYLETLCEMTHATSANVHGKRYA